MPSAPARSVSALRGLLHGDAAGGVLLIAAAALAMLLANAGPAVSSGYFTLLHLETGPVLSPAIGPMSVHLWINDALMALFFLLVGLEIKREFVEGRLASWRQRRLPVIAAAAGMAVPALVYLAVTRDTPALHPGWAIPAATDIAFALGVLALLGSRAPPALKLFLTTVAIVDDLGAIAIIALAYSHGLDAPALAAAALILAGMIAMNRSGVTRLWPYLLGFAALWLAVLLSGVHATVAGVMAALVIPLRGPADSAQSPLHRLERALHPWVAFAVVPLFGFANAGVSLAGVGVAQLLAPLPLGIAAGLVLGKQAGIFASVWLAVRLGIAERPGGAGWRQIYGIALLCGIGFTMSLFIGGLAFPGDAALGDQVKIGVLGGSILSAVAGFLLLRFSPPARPISR